MSETTCPVFYPDEQQFQDFRAFVEGLERAYPNMAICKIVPPKSWFVTNYDLPKLEETLVVQQPIKQLVSGRAGIYQLEMLELSDMSLKQFRRHCDKNVPESKNYADREKRFWTSVGFSSGVGCDPIYGSDIVGTLFTGEESHSEWNLNNLENLLRLLDKEEADSDGSDVDDDDYDDEEGPHSSGANKKARKMGHTQATSLKRRKRKTQNPEAELLGIHKPMLYIGSWRSMFAFHVEDMDLYSINYLHLGAEKSWYAIPPSSRKRFEVVAESIFESDRRECPQFLRHKTKIFSPTKLRGNNIPYVTAVQHPGEFVITFPGSYHAGFNHGFNIAEAVNFAFRRWIEIGRKAKRCLCQPHSVNIDVNHLETLYLRKRLEYQRHMRCTNVGFWSTSAMIAGIGGSSGSSTGTGVANIRDIMRTKSNRVGNTDFYFMEEILDDSVDYFDEFDGRIRCFCSMKSTYQQPLSPPPVPSELNDGDQQQDMTIPSSSSSNVKEVVQCQGCAMWFHPQCVRDAYTAVYDLKFVDIPMCHHCHNIECIEYPGFHPAICAIPAPAPSSSSVPVPTTTATKVKPSSSVKRKKYQPSSSSSRTKPRENGSTPNHPSHNLIRFAFQMARPGDTPGSPMTHNPISWGLAKLNGEPDQNDLEQAAILHEENNFELFHICEIDNDMGLIENQMMPMDMQRLQARPPALTKQEQPKKKGRAPKKKERGEEVVKGDMVTVLLPGALVETIGRIADIDSSGQYGRLHIKGSKREDDIWVFLKDCRRYVEPPLSEVELEEKLKAKQARKEKALLKKMNKMLKEGQAAQQQLHPEHHLLLQSHLQQISRGDHLGLDQLQTVGNSSVGVSHQQLLYNQLVGDGFTPLNPNAWHQFAAAVPIQHSGATTNAVHYFPAPPENHVAIESDEESEREDKNPQIVDVDSEESEADSDSDEGDTDDRNQNSSGDKQGTEVDDNPDQSEHQVNVAVEALMSIADRGTETTSKLIEHPSVQV